MLVVRTRVALLLCALNIFLFPVMSNGQVSARFRVMGDVVNPDVGAFAATVGGFGNSLVPDGGFEPAIFRNRLVAQKDSPDRIYASPQSLTYWDTFREGFLDLAQVQVYRISSGRFHLVREDTVKPGGAHASGWIPVMGPGKVLPPGTTRFVFHWAKWNRPDAPYYFTVRAIDRKGRLSPVAGTVSVRSPADIPKPSANNVVNTVRMRISSLVTDTLPAPAAMRGGVQPDGTLLLEWQAVDSDILAGYVVYRSDYPPDEHSGFYLQLSGDPGRAREGIKAGDMVIVSRPVYSLSRRRDLSNRVWDAKNAYRKFMPALLSEFPDESDGLSWRLVKHGAETAVEDPGETCLMIRVDSGRRQFLTAYNHAGRAQSWYEVLEPRTYRVEVWLRQEGKGRARFSFSGFYATGARKIRPVEFDVGAEWKKFVAYFTPGEVQEGGGVNAMRLEFSGPATFYVDNFRVYRDDVGYLDMLPRDVSAIQVAGVSALRTHAFVKTGIATYDMRQFTNHGGVIHAVSHGNTLPQTLEAMRHIGVDPWLQFEFHMSPDEWLGFVEYMAARYVPGVDTPESRPWAYKRYMQGRVEPWIDAFDRIYLEIGNETWNPLFSPWVFVPMTDEVSGRHYSAGEVYGRFQEYVYRLFRSSPYWSAELESKLIPVVGGWAARPAYGFDAVMASPSSKFLAIAAYNGGWDEGEGIPEAGADAYFRVLSQTSQSAETVAEDYGRRLRRFLRRHGDRDLRLGVYEAGPGYVMNGLNGMKVTRDEAKRQETIMKSFPAGVATLDAFLARAERGFDLQGFYAFGRGVRWSSHRNWYDGGDAFPAWNFLAIFNRYATGDMLRVDAVSAPRADLRGYARRSARRDAPLLAAYATRKGSRYAVFVVSRRVDGYPHAKVAGATRVRVDLPFHSAKKATMYRFSSEEDLKAILEGGKDSTGRDIPLAGFSGHVEAQLPAASVLLYLFDGVSP